MRSGSDSGSSGREGGTGVRGERCCGNRTARRFYRESLQRVDQLRHQDDAARGVRRFHRIGPLSTLWFPDQRHKKDKMPMKQSLMKVHDTHLATDGSHT